MKLSDIVSNSGLSFYAEVAMVIFLAVFALVALRLLFTGRRRFEHMAQLPLATDEVEARVPAPSKVSKGGNGEH